MEFGLREVLAGVGLLVIAGILFDGFRRMRRSKAGSLDLPSEMGGSLDDDWGYYKGELPNGGARVVHINRQEPNFGEEDIAEEITNDPAIDDSFEREMHDQETYIDEALYAQSDDRIASSPRAASKKPQVSPAPSAEESVQDYVNQSLDAQPEKEPQREEVQSDLFADDEMLARAKQEQERKLAAHYKGEPKARTRKRVEPKQVEPAPEEPAEDIDLGVSEFSDVIVINIMAKAGDEIVGTDLYRALASCGLHHGDMNIFHRYEQHNGQGKLLFSVANVVEPGTFEPQPTEDFVTPGICMFLKLPGPKRPLKGFEVMLDCARRISKILGADLKDEHHSVMTQQTFEHYRQRVIDFERKQLSQKALMR